MSARKYVLRMYVGMYIHICIRVQITSYGLVERQTVHIGIYYFHHKTRGKHNTQILVLHILRSLSGRNKQNQRCMANTQGNGIILQFDPPLLLIFHVALLLSTEHRRFLYDLPSSMCLSVCCPLLSATAFLGYCEQH